MAKGSSGAIRAGRAYVELFSDSSKLNAGLKQGIAKLKAFGASVASIGKQMLVASSVAAVPFALSARTAAGFEKEMSRVKALLNPTAQEFRQLADEAKRLGAQTSFTASQAAEAMSFFALAGFKTDQILKAMQPTLSLAAAGQLQIAEAADIVAKIMAGMGVAARDVGGAVDVMTKAMTTANTDLRMLGDAFKFVGPIAKSAGVPLETITAAIQMLSNAGIQGEMAGTTLRGALLSLTSPSKEAADEMKKLGIQVQDAAGDLLPFADIVEQFEKALAGMGSAQRLEVIGRVFDARQAAGFVELISQGAAKMREMDAALRNSAGAADRIAKTQLDNVIGDVTILTSALESLNITVGEHLFGAIRRSLQAITAVINAMQHWAKYNREVIQTAAKVVAIGFALGGGLLAAGVAIKIAAIGMGLMATTFGLVIKLFMAAKIAVLALASPLGLIIASIGAAGAALLYWTGLGGKALAWLMGSFAQLQAGVEEVIGAIVEALQKGNIAAAANIAWLGLKVVWKSGVNELTKIWVGFRNSFDKLVATGLAGVLRMWNDLSYGIRAIWIELQAFLVTGWKKTTTGIATAFAKTFVFVDEENLKRQAAIAQKSINEAERLAQEARAKGDTAGAARYERNAEQARQRLAEATPEGAVNERLRKLQAESDAAIRDVENKRKAAQDKLATDHANTMREIAADLDAAQQGLDQQAAREVGEAQRALEAARDALKKAIADARKPLQKGSAGRDKSGKSDISRFFEEARAKQAMAGGGAVSSGTISRGTFNAAAIQSLQGGTRELQKVAKAQLKVQSDSLDALEQIATKGVRARIAFGA